MATWLTNDLNANTQRWTIVYFHHPPYSKGSHNSDTETELIEMRQNIMPILEAKKSISFSADTATPMNAPC